MRALLALLLLAAQAAQPAPAGVVVIDHLILGIADLDRGIAEFEAKTGVRPVFGGVHPGRGTQNALASLGGGAYIEILAPNPKEENPAQPIDGLKALTTLTPVGWAAGTTDMFALQARLQGREIRHGAAMPGSRALPDGSRLQWSTVGIQQPAHDWMPFFIRWADPAKHPSLTTPAGCRLESLLIEHPNPDPLTHVFSTVQLKVPVRTSDRSRMTIVLECPKGRVTWR
ncbi:MAG TPA: VOC family protein [Vicinamibacterales bacterium]|nr:VOC family protein [Vicinamibacterales bacterium]